MKEGYHQKARSYRYSVPKICEGSDFSESDEHIKDANVRKSVNMLYRDGVFATRPVLSGTADDAFFDVDLNFEMDPEHIVTNTFVNIGGRRMKIIYIKETDYMSHDFLHIYYLAADGTKIKAGTLQFSRVDSEHFYRPLHILFFSGAPTSGNGVYAMLTRQNASGAGDKMYQIFENAADMQTWTLVTDYYIPTVLINGRGSQYEYSRTMGFAFTGTPRMLESKNLLNGSFAAYYTSDRFSSSFRLPFSNLTNSYVTCRVYADSEIYTDWVIEPGQTSVTATFYSARITLNINRTTGIITFSDANGLDYAFERFGRYHENNIRVTSSQFSQTDFENIVSSTCSAEYGSQLLFSGGNQPNRIYSVRKDNPLYFSESSYLSLGTDSKIIALSPIGNGVLALEKDQVHAIHLTPGKAINSHALLSDEAGIYYEKDTFSVSALTNTAGCVGSNGVLSMGKTTLWLGRDRRLHIYSASGDKERSLSDAVTPILRKIPEEDFSAAQMAANGEEVMLMFSNTAFLYRYHGDISEYQKGGEWYYFDFGDIKLKGGIGGNGSLRLLCAHTNSSLLYSAVFADGQGDTVIDLNSTGSRVVTTSKVSSSFTTKAYDFSKPQTKKFIDSIGFSADCEGVLTVSMNGKTIEHLRLRSGHFGNGAKSVTIRPKAGPVLWATLTFASESPFLVSDITFTYRLAE